MMKRLDADAYTIGWISPLPVEQIAAVAMLKEQHQPPKRLSAEDKNNYVFGAIAQHNVVILGMPQPGNNQAASVVSRMHASFKNLRRAVLVGIGGGVPRQIDNEMIRLGHVVVSKPTDVHPGVVQYDSGKIHDTGYQRTGVLQPAPDDLLSAAQKVEVIRATSKDDPLKINMKPFQTNDPRLGCYKFPGAEHGQTGPTCGPGTERPVDEGAGELIVVHRGTIASGGSLFRSAEQRDKLADRYGAICFEMEAAGALTILPCLVIRGISDFCDKYKDDLWKRYAAAVAAAYAKEVLIQLPGGDSRRHDQSASAANSGRFCYRCNAPDHKWYQCRAPHGAVRKIQKNRWKSEDICVRCGQNGHWRYECPNLSEDDFRRMVSPSWKPRQYYRCYGQDYTTNECPDSSDSDASESDGDWRPGRCHNCDEWGHWAFQCNWS